MMRKMRKEGFFKKVVSAVSAASLMAVVLTGCGGSSDSTAGTGSADNAADKVYKIGVTQISDHPSLDNCREGFIQGLKNEGFTEASLKFSEWDLKTGSAHWQAVCPEDSARLLH